MSQWILVIHGRLVKTLFNFKVQNTVLILSFRTGMPGQTVQTQIRLLRVYTVCHSVCIVWTYYSMVEPHSSNFRVITTNYLGVRIFRNFTVWTMVCTDNWFFFCFSFPNFGFTPLQDFFTFQAEPIKLKAVDCWGKPPVLHLAVTVPYCQCFSMT